jgi:hypothetical protein
LIEFTISGQPVTIGADALTEDRNLYDPATGAVVGTLDTASMARWVFRPLAGRTLPDRFVLHVRAVLDQADFAMFYGQVRSEEAVER